ncbi:hypothetical protein GQR58_028537 [Nymphon striatum]|nr:hypothetical protein GQR58_028537 [Nymphon striatum]
MLFNAYPYSVHTPELIPCWLKSSGWEKDGGCYNDTIRLDCESGNIIVIKSALYSTEIEDEDIVPTLCANQSLEQHNGEKCTQDLRLLFNSKCSGLRFCRFKIERDLNELSCNKTGFTFVSYRCVPSK